MRRIFPILLFLLLPLFVTAQLDWVANHPATITYTLDLAKVQQHELRITADFPAVGPGIFKVKMPQSSPGRYAQHNFAKNVYDLKAYASDGRELEVYPEAIAEWVIAGHDGAVKLEYTLFANGGDGTYSGIDDRKLHLNMPASFLYGEVLNDRPVMLKIKDGQRPDWTVASQLVDLGQRRFAAPNYYYFFDSPTMVGDIMRGDFAVKNPDGKEQTIEVAMMHEGTREEFNDYLKWTEDVVLAQQKVYGELPEFDYGKYTFLCAYNPWIGGDGMEHRNSTICSSTGNLAKHASRLIGTVSHEFFHCWNVERIRPASLEPFHFDHANMSGELWFAEGFTSYYDDLSLVRAGILSPEDYASGLTGQLNYVLLSPGRDHRSPIGMSQQAPFVDAATANDPNNFGNTFVSYYSYGATVGLALDLTLRERGHTLDEVMQLIWQRYGKTEIPYHVRDLQLALGEVAEDQEWAKNWFAKHVYGSDLPNIGALLDDYGFMLNPVKSDTVDFYRLSLKEDNGSLSVRRAIPENTPLYEAGLNQGCQITALNGVDISSRDDWDAAVRDLKIGQACSINFTQLGRERTGKFVASSSPQLKLTFMDGKVKKKVRKRREAWLKLK